MKPAKIGFVLLSHTGRPIPSTRVAVLNILPLLRGAGLDAQILFDPQREAEQPRLPPELLQRIERERFDLVVFQKVHGPDVLRLVRELRSRRIRTAYLVCDLVDEAMAEATDATLVVTDFLRDLYPWRLRHKIHVVHDGIEHPEVFKTRWREDAGSGLRPLQAVLVTSSALTRLPQIVSPPAWLQATIVGRYPPRRHWRQRFDQARWTWLRQEDWPGRLGYLRHLLDPRIRHEAWHPEGVYEHLRAADIGIIPIENSGLRPAPGRLAPDWMVKSDNRLTLKMALGLPVVATPIPAYEPVIEQGVNGFLARSPADWCRCLEALRDPQRRRSMGQRARASVLERFSKEAQMQRFLAALEGLVPRPDPRVLGPAGDRQEDGDERELPLPGPRDAHRASQRPAADAA